MLTRIIAVCMLFMSGMGMAVADTVPAGSLDNVACVTCHEEQDSDLIKAWQGSAHGKVGVIVDCVACHGDLHKDAAVKARQDETCINCHGGQKDPVVHSYATSKHGLILRLETKEWDWTQPLEQANYRTPGCAYCHMQGGEHGVVTEDAMRGVCQDCHAPRYISRLFENGEKMLALAQMKVREAQSLLLQARDQYTAEELKAAEEQYKKMKAVHLKNVYLGVAHQSPDYQWWHGHPALDGDLLRIKGFISELNRKKHQLPRH